MQQVYEKKACPYCGNKAWVEQEKCHHCFYNFRTKKPGQTSNNSSGNYKQGTGSTNHHNATKSPQNAYEVLGLSSSCSKEELVTAHRRLAKLYHPDQVSHLATEFQELAEIRMKDINSAVDEVKQKHGW